MRGRRLYRDGEGWLTLQFESMFNTVELLGKHLVNLHALFYRGATVQHRTVVAIANELTYA